MAANSQKRQRKLEQKKAKRKAKRTELVRQSAGGFAERVMAASHLPLAGCYATEDIEGNGMASVLLARPMSDGQIAFAMFLVDLYCLGVKDSFARIVSRGEFDEKFGDWIESQAEEIPPADARKLVEEAVVWARRFGFAPRGDFRKACGIFYGIDVDDATREYELGRNGRPCFFNGPDDTQEEIARIRHTLEVSCGPDGYDFVLALH
jgi:hypothetical protein